MRLKCFFCQNEKLPDYKDFDALSKWLSDRGKILGRDKSGACARHQRRLAREIKHARHLALLPFVS